MHKFNKIQVFGLQRSGTNFVEWTLINNFKDVNYSLTSYKDSIALGDLKGLPRFNQYQSIKHLTPTLKYSSYILAIYKDKEDWIKSIIKSGHYTNIEQAKASYDKWHEAVEIIPEELKIVINHKKCVENYFEFLDLISDKFKCTLIESPIQPMGVFNRNATFNGQKKFKLYK